MVLGYYASSPVLVAPLNQPPAYFHQHSQPGEGLARRARRFDGSQPSAELHRLSRSCDFLGPCSSAAAGRKRGRDDDSDGHGAGAVAADSSHLLESPARPLLHSRAYSALASSERPKLVSRKSQRLSQITTTTISPSTTATTTTTAAAATLDELISRVLGVGWLRVGSDSSAEAASRGWARYIANRFAFTDVEVLLQNTSDQSYLVKAAFGGSIQYCRFSEDLNDFRLITLPPGLPPSSPQAASSAAHHLTSPSLAHALDTPMDETEDLHFMMDTNFS